MVSCFLLCSFVFVWCVLLLWCVLCVCCVCWSKMCAPPDPPPPSPPPDHPSAGPPKISLFFSSPAIFILTSLSWGSFRGILVVFVQQRLLMLSDECCLATNAGCPKAGPRILIRVQMTQSPPDHTWTPSVAKRARCSKITRSWSHISLIPDLDFADMHRDPNSKKGLDHHPSSLSDLQTT